MIRPDTSQLSSRKAVPVLNAHISALERYAATTIEKLQKENDRLKGLLLDERNTNTSTNASLALEVTAHQNEATHYKNQLAKTNKQYSQLLTTFERLLTDLANGKITTVR